MKKLLKRLVFLFVFSGWAIQSQAAVNVTLSPTAISNSYNGTVTLQISGLTNGEKVVVQKFIDANGNGVVDSGDTLWQQGNVTDGRANTFLDGAITVTNLNVPGDTDAIAGQITAALNISQSGFEQTIAGKYIYVVTSPFGNFSPKTNTFTVTNFPYGQTISGSVIANGTNVPGAAVLLFQPSGNNNLNPKGGAVVDASGNYQISAPPGDYVLMPFKSNFVANAGAASVTLSSGVNLSSNLFLLSADRTISGSFLDASNSAVGLPGVLVPIQTQNGLLTVAFTDTNGNFKAGVTAGFWKVEVSDQETAGHNYLRPQNKVQVDATAGSVSGVTITLPKANAIFYGAVKDGFNQPLAGISLASSDQGNFEQDATSAADGTYFAGAYGNGNTPWQIQSSQDGNPANLIFSSPSFDFSQNGGTNLLAGQALHVNFVALTATNQITGHVQDHNNSPIANVQVVASAMINGANFQAQVDTDGGGNYSLNVANGTWSVTVSCEGGNDSLNNILGFGNYQCPGGQGVIISNNNAIANFTIQQCNGIQVLSPTNLPDGQVGVFYSTALSATTCSGNANWSLNSGTLPPGFNLDGSGFITGTCSTTGTYNFNASVSDGATATNHDFSIKILQQATPPTLGQATRSGSHFQFTVNGSVGQNYTIQAATNLGSTNWTSILVTNPTLNTFQISDTNATNPARFYRILIGP
jgi:hypothetical protein